VTGPVDAPATGPWLAVIDMERVFAEPGSPWLAPRFAEIIGPIRQLAAAMRPRVTFTRFIAPARPAGAWQRYYRQFDFAAQPPEAPMYQIADELADLAGESGPTLDATTFGKWGAVLADRTGQDGQLVLAGVTTDCCVLSTAVAAADAGVSVQVVAPACAGSSDANHCKALDVLRLYEPLVQVVSLEQALASAAG
jgi:nicotinamidase-related amidase